MRHYRYKERVERDHEVSFSAEGSENVFMVLRSFKAMCSSIQCVDVRVNRTCTIQATDIYEHKHQDRYRTSTKQRHIPKSHEEHYYWD